MYINEQVPTVAHITVNQLIDNLLWYNSIFTETKSAFSFTQKTFKGQNIIQRQNLNLKLVWVNWLWEV